MRFTKPGPPQAVLLSYVALIAVGVLLFMLLPTTKAKVSPIDALFTVTSAVTVTGLTVINTETQLTDTGKWLILSLIQIGGLGYMTLTTFLLITFRRKIGVKERLILSESLNYPGVYGLVRFLKRVVLFVFIIEAAGCLLLYIHWVPSMGITGAAFPAFFHSVSAFNNAGFSLFTDNLIPFRGDLYVNLVISALIFLGGIGFFVIHDIYLLFTKRTERLSTHTKLVLSLSIMLVVFGWLGLILTEFAHYNGIWSLNWKERLLSTLFLSVSSRTAGFNTVDIGSLSESSLFLLTILMFIGASPGSTGGGIKTTTFSVILLSVLSYVRGRSEVVVFNRSIPQDLIHRAMVVMALAFTYIAFVNLLIDRIEEKDFLSTLFEVVSAFATVGLSVGGGEGLSFSAQFSSFSKILIVLSMIVGRVGIVSFALALVGREEESRIKHPEARLLL
ncbi:trk system potassium uptake protein TrkH [Hydrogenivirga caldilitoris]|uniref:Trk system potassium uptake protein TrkH n=1 Tax=Hydrogenivirga caldilitoris TaxID=246264 RepID=A0A497XR49_9AQUI|nr:TrkH family potassium uptake protein [Hydrogenivirga caldilitoris]RLJ70650.1 trk system potassium uptake protein TrkH [Hydrogenivirga caldilitoris]